MTGEEVQKRLEAGEDEGALIRELVVDGHDALIECINTMLDTNGVYKHPRVALPMAAMLAGTVLTETLKPEDLDHGREMFMKMMDTSLTEAIKEAKTWVADQPRDGES